jgi:dipeptidyl aminopeptidase/acylaminoacyl peptidase
MAAVCAAALAQTAPSSLPTLETLRQGSYPGSPLTIERTLAAGGNYRRYLASYRSEGLRINALLTVPSGIKPEGGWPAVVFVHGYIPPAQYRTTERYVAYVDALARSGYAVFKIDLRGHGSSEGRAEGAYFSPGYTVDVLNAVSSLAQYREVNPERVGMWGHSMGGFLTLRAMVLDKRIKTGVVWAGVVAPYADLINNWRRPYLGGPDATRTQQRNQAVFRRYGTPQSNPAFWASVSANSYLGEGMAPIQIHHSPADTHVPYAFSQTLARQLREARQPYEFYTYAGDDHNLSRNFSLAMRRTVAYFDRYLKQGL